jgi:AraC family transcriptional regulator
MLVYLGRGPRRYDRFPLRVGNRHTWEFQAVVRGRIGPVFDDGPAPLEGSHLWVFPPGSPHGWTGAPGRAAEVAVFHFPAVPSALKALVGTHRVLGIELSGSGCARLRSLAAGAERYLARPGVLAVLAQEHLLLELCLLVAGAVEVRGNGMPASSRAHDVIGRALRWLTAHLDEGPGLGRVARAAGTSPAHLRRLFHDGMRCSPREAFARVRFQRVMDLMHDSSLTFEVIAERCGFGSASAFSRAFKARFGYSPVEWRRGLGGSGG